MVSLITHHPCTIRTRMWQINGLLDPAASGTWLSIVVASTIYWLRSTMPCYSRCFLGAQP